ncbi:MAG: HlyD family efflux transporter periplasmic adaptor subunit, partial [Thermoguttaceae bacterium]
VWLGFYGNMGAYYISSADNVEPFLGSVIVKQDESVKKVHAIGTIEPEETANLSAQVSGKIIKLGWDPRDENQPPEKRRTIDYVCPVSGPVKDEKGNIVKEGTLLAQIDDENYQIQVKQAEAKLQHAKSEKILAEANIKLAVDRLELAKSASQKETTGPSEIALLVDNLAVAKAALAVIVSDIDQKQADLDAAKLNLQYTRITSPIDGIIIDRRVSVGQSVTLPAGLGLFLIGNLKNLQVWASVNEADIPKIHEKQHVHFKVDAYPNDSFEGEVKQIRLNATMLQNRVTYTVVVSITDTKEKLLPYLTAQLDFQ